MINKNWKLYGFTKIRNYMVLIHIVTKNVMINTREVFLSPFFRHDV